MTDRRKAQTAKCAQRLSLAKAELALPSRLSMHLNRLDKWGENGGECLFPSHSHQVTNTRDAKCPVAGAAPHLQTMSHHHPLTSSFQNSTKPSEHTLQGSSMPMQPQATLSAPPPWGHKFTKGGL